MCCQSKARHFTTKSKMSLAKSIIAGVLGFSHASLCTIPWVVEAIWVAGHLKHPSCQYVILACGVLLTVLAGVDRGIDCYNSKWSVYSASFVAPWILFNIIMSWVLFSNSDAVSWYTHLFCHMPAVVWILAYLSTWIGTCLAAKMERGEIPSSVSDNIDLSSDALSDPIETYDNNSQLAQEETQAMVPDCLPLPLLGLVIFVALLTSVALTLSPFVADIVLVLKHLHDDKASMVILVSSIIQTPIIVLVSTALGVLCAAFPCLQKSRPTLAINIAGWSQMAYIPVVPWIIANCIMSWVASSERHIASEPSLAWYIHLMCYMPVLVFAPSFMAGYSARKEYKFTYTQVPTVPDDTIGET